MDKLFLIAGLGADTRIYDNLDFTRFEVVPVKWLPTDGCDGLESYARKLAKAYNITPNSIVIGNSLGAMIGVEIAKIIPLQKLILTSSIKTVFEAPVYFKLFYNVPIYNIIPEKLFKSVDFLAELVFGQMDKDDIDLFLDMMRGWSTDFLKWAMTAVLHWENETLLPNTYHINGDKDLVFPYKKVKDAIIIRGGTHIMIYDMPNEINAVLKKIFNNEIAPIVLPA